MGMLDSIIGMLGSQQPGNDFNSRFGALSPSMVIDPQTGQMVPGPAPADFNSRFQQASGLPSAATTTPLPMGGQDVPTPSWEKIDRTTPRPAVPALPWSAAPASFQGGGNLIGAGDTPSFGALSPTAPTLPPPITVPPPPGGVASPDPAALPPNATPTVGATDNLPFSIAPPGAFDNVAARQANAQPEAAPEASTPGFGSRVKSALENVAGILDPDMRQRQIANQTAQALVKKGLDPDMASAIATNPALLQQIVPQLFGPKKMEHVTIKDAFGNEIPLSFDSSSGRYYDASGKQTGPGGTAAVGGGTAGIPGSGAFLAKGVTQVNHDLQGDDYLKQFAPEVQAGVKNYLDGKTLTTGNARQGFTQTVKMIAQKYGADIGKPADDIAVNARRQMSNDLSKGTPGSLGGQITFGGTSLGHLADTAEKLVSLDNKNVLGIAPLSELVNKFRGMGVDQAAKVNEAQGAIQHYGQEITKFYTGSPGGEAERMRFLNTMNTAKTPQEMAGAIRAERDLIPDRLKQVEQQINDRLGPEEAAKHMKRVDLQGVTDRINRSLAKIDPNGPEAKMFAGQGGGAAAPANAAPAGLPSGWSVQVR